MGVGWTKEAFVFLYIFFLNKQKTSNRCIFLSCFVSLPAQTHMEAIQG